jgi:hypothetical protein
MLVTKDSIDKQCIWYGRIQFLKGYEVLTCFSANSRLILIKCCYSIIYILLVPLCSKDFSRLAVFSTRTYNLHRHPLLASRVIERTGQAEILGFITQLSYPSFITIDDAHRRSTSYFSIVFIYIIEKCSVRAIRRLLLIVAIFFICRVDSTMTKRR